MKAIWDWAASVLVAAVVLSGSRDAVAADDTLPAGFDQPREAPHGKVVTETYESKTLGFQRKMSVYSPPGYSERHKYPVLYLLHGSGDDETGWLQKGSANVILDNLAAEKRMAPMIVVMPFGFTSRPGEPTRNPKATPEERRKAAADFEQDLLKDVIPFVESHYSVVADKDHRALAGLSMGGGQTMRIGPMHSDTFAYLGVFSAGLRKSTDSSSPELTESYPGAEKLNSSLKLFWVSCGDHDAGLDGAKRFVEVLKEKKIHHVWHEDSGSHEWPVWKNDLYLIAQRLFKDK